MSVRKKCGLLGLSLFAIWVLRCGPSRPLTPNEAGNLAGGAPKFCYYEETPTCPGAVFGCNFTKCDFINNASVCPQFTELIGADQPRMPTYPKTSKSSANMSDIETLAADNCTQHWDCSGCELSTEDGITMVCANFQKKQQCNLVTPSKAVGVDCDVTPSG